jgi:tetratricopeptide (TPR) repeat protein
VVVGKTTRLALALGLALAAIPATATAGLSFDSCPPGAPRMLEPHTGSLLVDYYEAFLRDQDIESFRLHVSTRYTEGTLARLIESGNTQARRAAVLALGLFGSYNTNQAVARGLRDGDLTVRRLANDALWAIWFRADTAENNKTLEQVSRLLGRHRPDQAIALATRLIERAPNFAEAYNQRAIAQFALEHFEDSATDCRHALERNPYHIGALSGLAQCQLKLGLRREALSTFRRALKLQPYSDGLREVVDALESEGE